MRKKIDVIEECEKCSHVWFYLGVDECCLLMNKRPCHDDKNLDHEIPEWCPLPDIRDDIKINTPPWNLDFKKVMDPDYFENKRKKI